ncbi:MAG: hypothetical protein LIQ31_02630, partial [Planctomycetes bacterium]|nr:hypothetical protein [Planctomycetota bacterium]
MKILAGIDEAGLGPTIGPLATASAALRVPADWEPETPWEELSAAVTRTWKKGETRIAVADSKVIYSTAGLAGFERAIGAFSACAGTADPCGCLREKLPDAVHPCYIGGTVKFPAYAEAEAVSEAEALLRTALTAAGAAAAHLRAALLYEPELNSRYADGLNKNAALLMETGRHLRSLNEAFPDLPLYVVVDKQGGRNEYLPYLADLFPGAWIQEELCGRDCSRYLVRRPGGDMHIAFVAKGDRNSFAT